MSLTTTIKTIQDIMRKDDGVDGDAQRIGQLSWMLFLKIFDQREEEWEDDAEGTDTPYVSPIPDACRWRNWAKYKGKKPQTAAKDVIGFVNNVLFQTLKELEVTEEQPMRKVLRQIFEDSNNYMKSGTLFLGVIEKLDEAINFHDFTTRQQLGDIYEKILNDLRSAGNAGEFYTPRAITQFMVDRVDPRLSKREVVLDPACGTGGFLTATIQHLRTQLSKKSSAKDKLTLEHSIRGMEKKQLPHLLCTTNLLLHDIDVPDQIDHQNTLAKNWNDWGAQDRVDCVITNPPFGGTEEDGVGTTFPSDVQTRETADMFLMLIVKKLLKPGGRAALVLPDGFLFGEGVKNKIKEILLEKCNLHTIIRLPNGVFNPYTSIKTNLLFFTEGKPTETIWFYEHQYPAGYKSYSKTKPIQFKEFETEIAWWGNEAEDFVSREENEFAWKYEFKKAKTEATSKAKLHKDLAKEYLEKASDLDDEIESRFPTIKKLPTTKLATALRKQNSADKREADKLRQKASNELNTANNIEAAVYNLDQTNPNKPGQIVHDPDKILKEYKTLLGEIEDTQEQLKSELAAALAHHFEDEGA